MGFAARPSLTEPSHWNLSNDGVVVKTTIRRASHGHDVLLHGAVGGGAFGVDSPGSCRARAHGTQSCGPHEHLATSLCGGCSPFVRASLLPGRPTRAPLKSPTRGGRDTPLSLRSRGARWDETACFRCTSWTGPGSLPTT